MTPKWNGAGVAVVQPSSRVKKRQTMPAKVAWFAHPDADGTFIVLDTDGNLIALNVTEGEAHKIAAVA